MSPRNTAGSGKPAKPALKAPAGKPATVKSRSASPAATRARPKPKKAGLIDPADRMRFIAEAAYYKAERRGFSGGGELGDWIEAEAEIDALLNTRGAG